MNETQIPPLDRAVSDPTVTQSVSVANAKIEEWVAQIESNRGRLCPEETEARLSHLLTVETDPAIRTEAISWLAQLKSSGTDIDQRFVSIEILNAMQPVRAACAAAVQAALAVLDRLEAEAIAAETAAFQAYGIPREPTAIARRVQAARETLKRAIPGAVQSVGFNPLVRDAVPSGHEFDGFAQLFGSSQA